MINYEPDKIGDFSDSVFWREIMAYVQLEIVDIYISKQSGSCFIMWTQKIG